MNLKIISAMGMMALGVCSQEPITNFDEGLKKAKEESKLLIVDFSHPW